MMGRIRRSIDEKDQGFTLIELLVVIIIIGILAAIAIPVFLNQRRKGYDASVKSDLKTAATAAETYFVDNGVYPTTAAQFSASGFVSSKNNNIGAAVFSDGSGFCINGSNSGSNKFWSYDSKAGGLQQTGYSSAFAVATAGCPSQTSGMTFLQISP